MLVFHQQQIDRPFQLIVICEGPRSARKNQHHHLHIDIHQTFQTNFQKKEPILSRWQEHEG